MWYQPCYKVFDVFFITVPISEDHLHSFRPSGRRSLIWGTIPTFALKVQVKSRSFSVTFIVRTRNRLYIWFKYGWQHNPSDCKFLYSATNITILWEFQSQKVKIKLLLSKSWKNIGRGEGGVGIAASWGYIEVICRHSPVSLSPGKKNPGAQWIRGFVCPRAGLDVLRKRKILCWNSNPGPSSQ